jgi:hypothetical protein
MKTKWILAFALALAANGLTGGAIAQTQHPNGLGQNYVDAAPLGTPGNGATYTATMANEAAAAWQFPGTVSTAQCGSTGPQIVSKQTATSCAAWAYTKALAGHVKLNAANKNCYCPTSTDPVWQ